MRNIINRKMVSTLLSIVILLLIFPLATIAADEVDCACLGFHVDTDSYVSFRKNFDREVSEYYNGKRVGTTTIDYVTAHSKYLSRGQKINLMCVRILTEPATITVQKKILFIKYNEEMKFGISKLEVRQVHSGCPTAFLDYRTTADTATTTETYGNTEYLAPSYDGLGIRLDHSCTSTLTKGICECTNNSTKNGSLDLIFRFGTPSTTQQKERVFEQTYYYISQGVSERPDAIQYEALSISPYYKWDGTDENGNSKKCDPIVVGSSHSFTLQFTSFNTQN